MTKKNLVLLSILALAWGGLLAAPLQAEGYGGVFGVFSVYQKTSVSSPAGSGNVGPGHRWRRWLHPWSDDE